MRHSDVAWLSLAAAILAYEIAAPRGELLSEAVDRYRSRHPLITLGAIAYLTGHLARLWPRRVDPLHRLAGRVGR